MLGMSFSLSLSLSLLRKIFRLERKIRVSVFRAAIRGSRFTRSGLRNPYLDEISRFWDVKGVEEGGGKKGGAKLPAYFPIPYWPGQSCPRGYRGFIWRMLATHRFLFLAGVKSSVPRGCCQITLLPILWPLFYRKAFFSWHRHALGGEHALDGEQILRNFYSSLLNRLTLRAYPSLDFIENI